MILALFQSSITNNSIYHENHRAFAKQTLPALKHHLDLITAIDNEMKKAAAK